MRLLRPFAVALVLTACGPAGPERMETVPGEDVVLSFLEESDRLRLETEASELVVKVLAPEGWRAGQEGDQRPCFSIRADGEVGFDLSGLPSGAELAMDIAVRRGHYLREGTVSLELVGESGTRARIELDSSADLPVEERIWHTLRLGLEGDRAATLRLSYEGNGRLIPHVLLSELTLRVPTDRVRARASSDHPSMVVVVIDTLRADALGAYGYERAVTPTLDALAQRGLLFERAYSAAPWTVPSTASLLTGLTPAEHGVDFDSTKDPLGTEFLLAESHRTLAEVLQVEGFPTAGFSCNPLVSARSNMHQGFDHFKRYGWSQAGEGPVDDALAWIEEREGERFFLYLHLVDPHAPYGPDEAFEEAFSAEAPESFASVIDGSLQNRVWKKEISEEDFDLAVDHARLLYDGEVASVDAQLGRFFGELERLGLLDTTLIAVTSDHGEEFGEYGAIGHVNQLYDPTLRVPLLLAGPGLPGGVRVPTPVENRRLASTLLGLAGIDAPAPYAEAPLVAQEQPGGPIFFSTRQGRTRIGRHDRWTGYEQFFGVLYRGSLLHWIPANDRHGDLVSLFDLEQDPDARMDLARREPDRVASLKRLIEGWLERGMATRIARGARSVASEPDLEALRGLGYLDED